MRPAQPQPVHEVADHLLDRCEPHQRVQFGEEFVDRRYRAPDVRPVAFRKVFGFQWLAHHRADALRPGVLEFVGEVAHGARVAELPVTRGVQAPRDLPQEVFEGRCPAQPECAQPAEQDGVQFGRFVVGEVDDVGDGYAAAQADVRGEEFLHLVRVAGRDQHESAAVVLHAREQRVDGLGAETAAPRLGQPVDLVDQQHPVEGPVHGPVGTDRRAADHTRHQVGDLRLHQVAAAQQTEVPVDLAHQPGDRGLAGAGIAREHQVGRARLDLAAEAPGTQCGVRGRPPAQPLQMLLDGAEAHHGLDAVGDAPVVLRAAARPLAPSQFGDVE